MSAPHQPGSGLFSEPPKETGFPTAAVSIAAVAVLLLIGLLAFTSRKHGDTAPAANTLQPDAPYAASLVLSGIAMSEADSLSGGKSIYLDGHIANHGSATVTAVTVQVAFAGEPGTAPQLETVPMNLIRMREPYIDTQSIASAPIPPGGEADFRLIFEGVAASWNQQTPDVHLVRVATR